MSKVGNISWRIFSSERKPEFTPIWYTIPEFATIKRQSFYHKEQNPIDIEESSIKNLHVLTRAKINNRYAEQYPIILRITADDYYKVYVNGIFVGQGPAPAYPEKYYYNEIDVTKFMKDGNNLIAVHTYYQGLINRVWNSGDGRFGLAADLVIQEDGIEVVKQLTWEYQVSHAYTGDAIGYNTQFLENFDSRLWDKQWNQQNDYVDVKKEEWKPMVRAEWADYHLVIQPTHLIDVYEVTPKIFKPEKNCSWFVDAGQEIVGSLILKARGRPGQKVSIFCGEELRDDGSVCYDMRCNCRYEEIWTLADGESELEPYDYKGFRYAWIKTEEGVEILDAILRIRHYPLYEEVCTLETDHPILDQIFQLCKSTIKYGTQEGYLDCPTREKGQYLGDAIISSRAHLWLTGSNQMLRKCIDQFAQSKEICPGLMAVAPGLVMQEIADFSLLWSEMLLVDYKFTGDKKFLAEYYPVAKDIIIYFKKYKNEEGLLEQVSEKWNLVDWPEYLRDEYDFALTRPVVGAGCHNVIYALYVGAVMNISKIESILGCPLSESLTELKDNFQKAFYDKERKLFVDCVGSRHTSIHANIYPLYYGLVPEEAVENVVHFLMNKGLCCGPMLSFFFMKGLAREGYYKSVYELMINDSNHGWVNMLKEGATTCFESWGKNQKWNTSLCHPWSVAPLIILIEDIAGYILDPESPNGYRIESHIPDTMKKFELKIKWLRT